MRGSLCRLCLSPLALTRPYHLEHLVFICAFSAAAISQDMIDMSQASQLFQEVYDFVSASREIPGPDFNRVKIWWISHNCQARALIEDCARSHRVCSPLICMLADKN